MRASDGQLAHTLDDADPLGDGYRAAGVERVEYVRALQRPVVRGQDELRFEAMLRFASYISKSFQCRSMSAVSK